MDQDSGRSGLFAQRKPIRQFRIGDRVVGEGQPCFVVAEVGLSHDGSLGTAHAFVDAVGEAGADAVKFQTHIAEAESTKEEEFRVNVFPQDRTRHDYWRRTQFTEDQWRNLKAHATEKNLIFLSSPFSLEAVSLLQRIGVQAWKVGSGEANNLPMLEEMAKSGLPILLSTGMSYLAEIDEAVCTIQSRNTPLLLYQCTNRYPCPPEHIGLNMIQVYRERYQVPVGFSDHSGEICTGIAAHCLGACSLEVHVTFHRKCFGPDVPASLTLEELQQLIASIRFLEMVYSSPTEKDVEAHDLEAVRSLFNKSVVARVGIPAGKKLTAADLAFKKPGIGIPAKHYAKVLGKVTVRNLGRDEFFSWSDLTDA